MQSLPRSRETPRIVAEALIALGEAPIALRQGPPAEARAVAARIARAALPPEAAQVPAPAWLRPEQIRLFRRTAAALLEFGGALVAAPTGAGKTWIALAAAATIGRGRAVCLVPASLADQWRAAAATAGVHLTIATHERASRGRLPSDPGFAIIDESHHYRNRTIHRYAHVSRWLVGRRTVLLTATPLVNRIEDLLAQLALVIRDDALAALGVSSLKALSRSGTLPAQVARLVLMSPESGAGLPARRRSAFRCEAPTSLATMIGRLTLSRRPGIAALIRGVLLRAAASSPAALAGALRRYRLLLLNARDAHASGVRPGRAALQRWIGETGAQTALWPLLEDEGDLDLVTGDLEPLARAERLAARLAGAPNAKVARLACLLAERRRTLVFTASRETALWLRDRLGPAGIAWCTGDRAGIGRAAMARREVLAAFRPGVDRTGAPMVLIATDVAAEGLDLQAAERVIHFDLPWTPMRLEQREGRAARLGNASSVVDVVRLDPPPELDALLRQSTVLAQKARLPVRAGLAGAALDRWRALVEFVACGDGAIAGTAQVEWDRESGALAALTLIGRSEPAGSIVIWCDAHGRIHDDPGHLAAALDAAARSDTPATAAQPIVPPALVAHARRLLRDAHGAVWLRVAPSPAVRELSRRLAGLGRTAARERSASLLDVVDHAFRFVSRGHSAGEELLLAELARLPLPELSERLRHLPASPERGAFDVRLDALIYFRSITAPLR